MTHRAILRWPNGSEWGHAATIPEDGGAPRFAGFVRMSDPRVQELLAAHPPLPADDDMFEVYFTLTDHELLSV